MVAAENRARVCAAIRAAEAGTSAEFVCVMARNASRYELYPLLWSSVVALLTPWVLVALTRWPVDRILLVQLVVFVVLQLALSTPAVRMRLVPRRVQRAAAHRAAAEQFLIRGLAHTPHRRGVLLYLSLDEHYARVLADEGAASAVPDTLWHETVRLLTTHARERRHADGFVAALGHLTEGMQQALPPDAAAARVLPDRFYAIE